MRLESSLAYIFKLCILLSIGVHVSHSWKISSKNGWALSGRTQRLFSSIPPLEGPKLVDESIRGKIIVSGIGNADEDEFMLSLLNEQTVWESVILATPFIDAARKKFLSRTARYSGLLNILDFAQADANNAEQMKALLSGADAWIAFDVSRASLSALSSMALEAGVKRVVMTTSLPPSYLNVNDSLVPEFSAISAQYQEKGSFFTGIRHGQIVSGDEDFPYEIIAGTEPLLGETVERGVLARVVAELLRMGVAFNGECGVSSAGDFSRAYLNILRSSGLTRREEVYKMFSGGVQKAADLLVNRFDKEQSAALEKKKRELQQAPVDDSAVFDEINEQYWAGLKEEPRVVSKDGRRKYLANVQDEGDETLTIPEKIEKRTEQILLRVFKHYNGRMYTRATSLEEFYRMNRRKARELAVEEVRAEVIAAEVKLLEKESTLHALDRFANAQEVQYSRLLAIERRELQHQKQASDIWVKYIYLLLELTTKHCQENNILFHNMDQYQQTILLAKKANELRAKCNLPPYDVVYDSLDATEIVTKLSADPDFDVYMLNASADDEIVPLLKDKYGPLLKKVPALRGATEILEVAVDTLRQELPPPPPTPNELRRKESAEMQQKVSKERLEAIRNRGMPFSEKEGNIVKL